MPTRTLLCVLAALLAALAFAQEDLVRWDFETGDLQGWRVVSGNLPQQPSQNDDDRWGSNFDKQGRWFIGTYEGGGDAPQGEIHSPVFTISTDKIALLVGGGDYDDATFVALVLAEGDEEICRATGHKREAMQQVMWDVSGHKGKKAYVRVVDARSEGWGHVNLDDVRELSPAGFAEIERKERERKAAAEKRFQEWTKTVFAPAERTVYRDRNLDHCFMQLGGTGAGNIALNGNGSLTQWQVSNHVNSRALVPYGFLGVRARADGGETVARVLQTPAVDDLPTIAETEFIGEFPIGYVSYLDDALPVKISLEAFTSFIPGNAADSALPIIYFLLTAENPGDESAQVGLMMSLQNFIGWDGYSEIEGVANGDYGGNVNRVVAGGDRVSVVMENPTVAAEDKNFGTLALTCLDPSASTAVRWDDSAAMWDDFAADGKLDEPGPDGPSAEGQTHNGAVACRFTLGPTEAATIPFILSWHFPNRYADYNRHLATYRLGNMYNNWFEDAAGATDYAADNFPRLRDQTRLYHDTFCDSNLPYWLLDCVGSQASTLCTYTCMWIEDGTWHAFEGSGSCPMNCTHVWNYEQTMAHLFPELERNVRHTDYFVQQDESGFIHHRTTLPLHLPRGSGAFVDGHLSSVSKAYREHRLSADDAWLREFWPRIKLAMNWAIDTYDPDGDGVIQVEQWNTYDCAVWGANTFIGSQWLAALRAAEEMAGLMGEPDLADRYRAIVDKGAAKMDRELWNGEWWVQDVDIEKRPKHQYGIGCHSDQLMGQWWAYVNGLGRVLPKDHARVALASIFKHNFLHSFEDFVQSPRIFAFSEEMGLIMCSWPNGGRPPVPTIYSDEVWTGIEYEVAALMIEEGMIEEGYQIIKAARDRYDGTGRSPWNEIECGEHYARAMSSWSILTTCEGYYYDGPAGLLRFAPKVQQDDLRAFFTVAEGWGTFDQKREGASQTNRVELAYGALGLRALELQLPEGAVGEGIDVTAKLRDQPLRADVTLDGQALRVTFPGGVSLSAGDSLTVAAQW